MDKQILLKKIDNIIEVRKTLWTSVIVLNSGIATLLLTMDDFSINNKTVMKVILLFIGFGLDYLFFNSITVANNDVSKLFGQLERENE